VTLAVPSVCVAFRVYIENNAPEVDLWFGWYTSEGADLFDNRGDARQRDAE
jgi:hypothetical protein